MSKSELTVEYLENHSRANSFVRGQTYYQEGAVERIVKKDNVYEAQVYGTRRYTVVVHEHDLEFEFFCNCPYNFEGFCKHSIAVGLAIINSEFTIDQEPAKKGPSSDVSKQQFFEEIFPAIENGNKIEFLTELLRKHDEMRSQFMAFLNQGGKADWHLSVDDIREQVHETLSSLDFSDIDYESVNYSSYGRYVEQWELDYDIAKEKVSDVFSGYKSDMLDYLNRGSLLNAFTVLLGVYEGWNNIHYAENDDHCIFDDTDYNYELLTEFKYIFESVIHTLEKTVFSNVSIKKSIKLLFDRFRYYSTIEAKEEDIEDEIYYDLTLFEDLIISLLINRQIAEYVNELLEEYQVSERNTVHVRLKIAELLEDSDSWYQWAEQFAGIEYDVTNQLLGKYDQSQNQDRFYAIAKKALNVWPDKVDTYLLSKVSSEVDRQLYVSILTNYTKRKKDIQCYKELRDYLSVGQRNKFISECRYHGPFYVQVLKEEERFDDILDYVKKNFDSYDFHLLIRPILNVYPVECFEVIRGKTRKTLKNQRGRNVYQQIILWLSEMKKIQPKQRETEKFIKELFDWTPRLPALRDELRRAELIIS